MKKTAPDARPTLAAFVEAFGPLKGSRLWGFLAAFSLLGRNRLQDLGVHRTAITKNLLVLTAHPGLSGTRLTGHHVRGRSPRELLEDFLADLVEATYQGQIAYKDFRELAQVLRDRADGIEEALRQRAELGPLSVILQEPKPARGKRRSKATRSSAPAKESPALPSGPTATPVAAPLPARRQRKRKAEPYLSSGYCELCTSMWPDDWKPALTGRGMFRCLGCKQELDIGLRMEPTRSTMRPIPRPASYRREDLEKSAKPERTHSPKE